MQVVLFDARTWQRKAAWPADRRNIGQLQLNLDGKSLFWNGHDIEFGSKMDLVAALGHRHSQAARRTFAEYLWSFPDRFPAVWECLSGRIRPITNGSALGYENSAHDRRAHGGRGLQRVQSRRPDVPHHGCRWLSQASRKLDRRNPESPPEIGLPRQLQPRWHFGPFRESVRFDPKSLKRHHVRIAQGLLPRGKSQMLPTAIAAAGDQHRQLTHCVCLSQCRPSCCRARPWCCPADSRFPSRLSIWSARNARPDFGNERRNTVAANGPN